MGYNHNYLSGNAMDIAIPSLISFDKIYPSKKAMFQAIDKKTDGIFNNRFVLIHYEDGQHPDGNEYFNNTIWQKVWHADENNIPREDYLMVGSLDSAVAGTLNVGTAVIPPTDLPKAEQTNQYAYGNIDDNGSIVKSVNSAITIDVPGAWYFEPGNLDFLSKGFTPEIPLTDVEKVNAQDKIDLVDKPELTYDQYTTTTNNSKDTKIMNLYLQSIGRTIDDIWNLVYPITPSGQKRDTYIGYDSERPIDNGDDIVAVDPSRRPGNTLAEVLRYALALCGRPDDENKLEDGNISLYAFYDAIASNKLTANFGHRVEDDKDRTKIYINDNTYTLITRSSLRLSPYEFDW